MAGMKPFMPFILAATFATGAIASAPSCERLAAEAADRYGIPPGLLTAIAHTESGRSQKASGLRAWPWTANVRGRGFYFDSRQQALSHLKSLAVQGEQFFDVGCMQINYRWHRKQFSSLSEMIDPGRNTDYAARYLRQLWEETGDWNAATRYYHSRDPQRGRAYLKRVQRALARLDPVQSPRAKVVEKVDLKARPASGDRRFVPGRPLIGVSEQPRYWQHPLLQKGALPIFPRSKTIHSKENER